MECAAWLMGTWASATTTLLAAIVPVPKLASVGSITWLFRTPVPSCTVMILGRME